MRIEHRIGLPVPVEAVWEAIVDIEAWPEWNPLYRRVEGKLRIGERLVLEAAYPGRAPMILKPTIVDWVPNDQIHWREPLLGGLASAYRYIELEKMGETGCIFSNGEAYRGWLGPRVLQARRRWLRAGFEAMGEAVRRKLELPPE
jgi:hypothetical protein